MTNRKVTLEFDVADLPMLAGALRTTICEAMMSQRPRAQARAEAYRQAIEALIPEPAKVFSGLTWSDICIALDGAASYSVGFEEWGYDWSKDSGSRTVGRIYVAIGGRARGSHDTRNSRDDGTLEAVRDLVAAMAPLDSVHVPVEDTKARHLRPQEPAPAGKPADPIRYSGDEDDYGERYSP